MMNKPKKILMSIAILFGLLLVVPFLIPMQTYLREAEKLASEKLGQAVTIQSAHLFLLPSPRVVVRDIVVGKRDEIIVAQLVVIPAISTLFSDTKLLDLRVSKPIIKKAALSFVSALATKKLDDSVPINMHIRHIEVDELQLVWPRANYPAMNAEATLTEAYTLKSAELETLDGKLQASVTSKAAPSVDEQLIMVSMNKWVLPVGLPLLIDNGKLEMHRKGSKLSIPKIDVALYGGQVKGNAELNWTKSWRLKGSLNVDNLAVKQPSKMLSQSAYLSGKLFADGSFSAKAKDAGQLADKLQANFEFKVNSGVLHGLDLVKVASLLIKQNKGGGETQFDALSGLLNVTGKQYHLRNLKVSSGLLKASGQVKVKPNKSLDGAVVVDVKNSMGLAGIPLDISGTVSNPVVLPNKAALVGAIAGTAVLPGIGTSIGAKVGAKTSETLGKLKGLFD